MKATMVKTKRSRPIIPLRATLFQMVVLLLKTKVETARTVQSMRIKVECHIP